MTFLDDMTTDHEGDVNKYIRSLRNRMEKQERVLRSCHKYKRNYIHYLERLNAKLFAENKRLNMMLKGKIIAVRKESMTTKADCCGECSHENISDKGYKRIYADVEHDISSEDIWKSVMTGTLVDCRRCGQRGVAKVIKMTVVNE